MQITAALHDLGVRPDTLTPSDRESLDRKGFLIVPDALPPVLAATMASRLDALAAEEGDNAGKDFQVEKGATRLGTLINKDPVFDLCFLHPRALAAVNYLLRGDFGLSSITGRAAQPGEGHQALHRDNQDFDSANVLWTISDFTPENGPTRLVPGTHLHASTPQQAMVDSAGKHPEEIYLIAPAGTLLVINGRTWHGGTRNGTNRPRHLVSAFFMPRGHYQPEAHRRLNGESRQRLSESARYVIDFESAAE